MPNPDRMWNSQFAARAHKPAGKSLLDPIFGLRFGFRLFLFKCLQSFQKPAGNQLQVKPQAQDISGQMNEHKCRSFSFAHPKQALNLQTAEASCLTPPREHLFTRYWSLRFSWIVCFVTMGQILRNKVDGSNALRSAFAVGKAPHLEQ